MKFGICIPNNWGMEDVQSIFQVATRAEELGFDSVWVSEHIFNTSYIFDRIGDKPYYDPLAILSYVSAITKKVGLGTSVLVLPYHNPIRLAKTAATLDVMSGGRLILGVGVGVIEEELNAMGASLAERGSMSDEAIAIMKELWTQEDPSFQGSYHSFSGMKFSPKPLQKPHMPLLIGGLSHSAIRRAARVGDGWHASTVSAEELTQGVGYLQECARAAGRDVSEIPVSVRLDMGISSATSNTYGRSRYSLGADAEEITRNSQAFERLGVETIVIAPTTGDTGETLAALEMLTRDVLPAFQ